MNFSPFVSSKKYINFLNRTHFLNGMYIVCMSIILLGIALIFIHSIAFLLQMLDETLWISETDMPSSVESFDIEKLASFAPKLGIIVPLSAGIEKTPNAPLLEPAASSPELSISPQAVQVDKAAMHLRILNGSNISGLAKKWNDWFMEQGFTHITIGNAPERNHTRFKIMYPAEKKDYLESIRGIIQAHHASIAEEVEHNAVSSEITIIIGAP